MHFINLLEDRSFIILTQCNLHYLDTTIKSHFFLFLFQQVFIHFLQIFSDVVSKNEGQRLFRKYLNR